MGVVTDQQVGEQMAQRRRTLKMSMRAAAKAGGTSPSTWSDLERGVRTNPDMATQRAVARALGWSLDWLDRILDGGEPELDSAEPVSQPDVADVLRRVELLEELVVELRETQAEEAERTAHSASAILDRLSTIEQRLTG
jgi:transcriptional regulator with XRE-family HTH domain